MAAIVISKLNILEDIKNEIRKYFRCDICSKTHYLRKVLDKNCCYDCQYFWCMDVIKENHRFVSGGGDGFFYIIKAIKQLNFPYKLSIRLREENWYGLDGLRYELSRYEMKFSFLDRFVADINLLDNDMTYPKKLYKSYYQLIRKKAYELWVNRLSENNVVLARKFKLNKCSKNYYIHMDCCEAGKLNTIARRIQNRNFAATNPAENSEGWLDYLNKSISEWYETNEVRKFDLSLVRMRTL